MEILLGIIFWPTVILVWLLIAPRFRRIPRIIGTSLILGLPALAVLSLAHWTLLEEPLMAAAGKGDLQEVKHLVSLGAHVNAADEGGTTVLGHAVESRQIELVRYLLAQGADVNDGSDEHSTPEFPHAPLAIAQQQHNQEMVALLWQAGAKK